MFSESRPPVGRQDQDDGLILLRTDGLAFTVPNQLDGIADSNLAAPDHVTIQGERAVEFPYDVCEHLTVLFQRVGIERRHDAAPTQVLNPDDDISDAQALPGPRALGQTFDTAEHKVWPEPPAVIPKSRDGSIRRDQQGEHVKAIARLVANQSGIRTNNVHNILADLWIAPQHAVNDRLAGHIECGVVTQKPMVCSGRDHVTAPVLRMNDAIPLDAKRTDTRVIQSFTGHRLYRVSPNLCNLHDLNSFPIVASSFFLRLMRFG